MSKRVYATFADGEGALIQALADQSKKTEDCPDISQSHLVRLLCRHALNDLVDGELNVVDETLADNVDGELLNSLIPDSMRAKYLREDIKTENWLVDMKGGFEGRVRREFRKRFANGYEPEAIAELARGFQKEAHIYWQAIDGDTETYQEKCEYVEAKVQEYREKHNVSTFDADDGWLSFEGVAEGEGVASVESNGDAIAADVAARLQAAVNPDADAICDAVAKQHGVSGEHVRRYVEGYRDNSSSLTEPEASALTDGGNK